MLETSSQGGHSRSSTRIALVAVLTGLALGTNYALIDIPNVKLMDALVFSAALLFGLRVGTGVAVSTWLVYGTVNPWGQDSAGLLLFLMLGECFYAVAGYSLRRTNLGVQLLTSRQSGLRRGAVFGMVGLLATFAYDVLTNFASYAFTLPPFEALLIGMATGLPFAVIHEVTNMLFFATVAPAAILAARRFMINTKG